MDSKTYDLLVQKMNELIHTVNEINTNVEALAEGQAELIEKIANMDLPGADFSVQEF